jgi:hypothetical protein
MIGNINLFMVYKDQNEHCAIATSFFILNSIRPFSNMKYPHIGPIIVVGFFHSL